MVGREHIGEAAQRLGFPLILKHNRGGKGLGDLLVRHELLAIARQAARERA